MNNEELEKELEERVQKKEAEAENAKKEIAKNANNNFPAEKVEMPNFIPKINTDKELEDQASDVIKIMGAQRASQQEDFMDEVAKQFQKGVLTEQEVKNMQRARMLEQEYFMKWQEVLKFVFIKSAHGLLFMQIMTIIAMFIYVPTRIIGMFIKAIGMIGDYINEIFNSVFGDAENKGYNLFAKLLFGIIIGGVCLSLVFVFIQIFTGFNVFEWFRSVL